MGYLIALVITCLSLVAHAAEIVREQGFEVQVQPFPSTFLTQDVASLYGFERSRRQALINVVVLKVQADVQDGGVLLGTVNIFLKSVGGQTKVVLIQRIYGL